METYLFIALIFIYILTAVFLPQRLLKRLWTSAYIISFILTATAIMYVKIYADETLMKVGELNWYYLLYVFGSVSIVLGVIVLWLYKHGIIELFKKKNDDDGDEEVY